MLEVVGVEAMDDDVSAGPACNDELDDVWYLKVMGSYLNVLSRLLPRVSCLPSPSSASIWLLAMVVYATRL